ncbi:MAG TPA: hypothetical protein DEO40_07715 [Treponema sp.]|jgi:DNA repair protein RadC|nr:DNA repair protein RadC [Treponema sp.]HAK69334.1 hypothetical protein [Treponema sp.]HBB43233.1 hypothetical protein [Treponema sp.]HCA20547.1 hypothetical protein [Treponema sp.]
MSNIKFTEVNELFNPKAKPNIRELTKMNGISYPSDEELVMLILNKGTREMPVERLAEKAISIINTTDREKLVEKLLSVSGIGDTKALALAAALELGRRKTAHLRSVIEKPSDVIPFVHHFALEPMEHFVCVSVNGAHEVLSTKVISVGTSTRTLVHPREVLAQPVMEHASGIICCHNHPCGLCYPSRADIAATEMLQSASTIMGITFLDHLIITREGYFSFLEHDMLTEHRQGEKMEDEEALAMS